MFSGCYYEPKKCIKVVSYSRSYLVHNFFFITEVIYETDGAICFCVSLI